MTGTYFYETQKKPILLYYSSIGFAFLKNKNRPLTRH
jgi:hypothetical protein